METKVFLLFNNNPTTDDRVAYIESVDCMIENHTKYLGFKQYREVRPLLHLAMRGSARTIEFTISKEVFEKDFRPC